jgi:hypothetical protein
MKAPLKGNSFSCTYANWPGNVSRVGGVTALAWKNLSKLPQFFRRRGYA